MKKIKRRRLEGNVHFASSACRLLPCTFSVSIAQGQNGFVAFQEQRVSASSRKKLHTGVHLAQVSFKAQGKLAIAFQERRLVGRTLTIRLMKPVQLSSVGNWLCRIPWWQDERERYQQQQYRNNELPKAIRQRTLQHRSLPRSEPAISDF